MMNRRSAKRQVHNVTVGARLPWLSPARAEIWGSNDVALPRSDQGSRFTPQPIPHWAIADTVFFLNSPLKDVFDLEILFQSMIPKIICIGKEVSGIAARWRTPTTIT